MVPGDVATDRAVKAIQIHSRYSGNSGADGDVSVIGESLRNAAVAADEPDR